MACIFGVVFCFRLLLVSRNGVWSWNSFDHLDHDIGTLSWDISHRVKYDILPYVCSMFQGLTIWAFCSKDGNLNLHVRTIKKIMSVGPTYVIMKFLQCEFDQLLFLRSYWNSLRLCEYPYTQVMAGNGRCTLPLRIQRIFINGFSHTFAEITIYNNN